MSSQATSAWGHPTGDLAAVRDAEHDTHSTSASSCGAKEWLPTGTVEEPSESDD